MKIIMKYFTGEGKFSRLYTYHIRLLMHFSRVGMLNLPYFLFRNVDKMAHFVQKKPYPQRWALSIITSWSRSLCFIISISSTSLGKHLFLMASLGVLKFLYQCLKKQGVLLAVPKWKQMRKPRRLELLKCPFTWHIKEAQGDYLQQPSEYYLHPGWKGSRLLHQIIGKCYLHLGWKGLFLLLQKSR